MASSVRGRPPRLNPRPRAGVAANCEQERARHRSVHCRAEALIKHAGMHKARGVAASVRW